MRRYWAGFLTRLTFPLLGTVILWRGWVGVLADQSDQRADGISMIAVASVVIGIFIAVGIGSDFENNKGPNKARARAYTLWLLFSAVMILGNYPYPWWTLLILGICTIVAGIMYDIENDQKAAAEKRIQEEHKKLVEKINQLIGNESETKALLTALDRLTQYVPEVAERILVAVRNDAERFVMLRGLIETTQNEVLKQKCSSEADDIVTSARKLCSDSTEMALELLEEYQAVEADQTLGEVRGSQLAAAHAEFKHYLEGLREALPKVEDKLASEIDSLSPPKQVLRLKARGSKRT